MKLARRQLLTLFFSARHAHFHYLDLRDARNRVHIPFSVFSNSTPSSLACSSNNLQKADGQSYSPLRRYFARPTSSDVLGSRDLCSSERGGNRQSCDWGREPLSRRQTDLGRKPLAGQELLKVLLINNKRAHKKRPKLPAIGGLNWQRLHCI